MSELQMLVNGKWVVVPNESTALVPTGNRGGNRMETRNQGAAGAKLITVKFAAGTRQPETVLVLPGTTMQELLNKLGLGPEFQLSRGTPDSVFALDESIYPNIQDGDLLFVTSRVDAGCLA